MTSEQASADTPMDPTNKTMFHANSTITLYAELDVMCDQQETIVYR